MTLRKTIHCQFRLLNILFSDSMVHDFFSSGNTPTKEDLEHHNVGIKSVFWTTVHSAFMHGIAYKYGFADKVNFIHPQFENQEIDPSKFLLHSPHKLYDMWKEYGVKDLK